jgi:hypothetical protein
LEQIMAKPRIPRTKAQKGKFWATVTLLVCGAFSIFANVRSGRLESESVVVSVMPPVVAFLSSHLISYFSPRNLVGKILVYGVGGLIAIFAMYGSGWHIVEFVVRTGQPWTTAVSYVFITDAPMLLAAAILIEKVSTARSDANAANRTTTTPKTKATTPVKQAPPAKATVAAKTTKPPAKRAVAPKTTVPTFKAAVVDETADIA